LSIWHFYFCAFAHETTRENRPWVIDILLVQFDSVEKDIATDDFNIVSRDPDNTLDKVDSRILGRVEYDHVAAIGGMKAIRDFVGQDVLAILEVGLHGATVNLMGLEEEDVDDGKDGERDHDGFEEIEEK
jgi:hypothetical protein